MRFFLLIICFFLCINLQAQNYHYTIIFFQGNIKINEKYVEIGMKINQNDKIIFENKENKVILINQSKEKFFLDFRKYQTQKNNTIRDVIIPIQNTEKIRTRCVDCPQAKTLQALLGLQKNSEPTKFIIIGDTYKLKYKCDVDKCLFLGIHYVDNNRDPRVIKIGYNGDKYFLDKSIFKGLTDSLAYCQLYEISYQNFSPKKTSQEIDKNDFNPKNIKAIFEPIYIEKDNLRKTINHYLSLIDINEELIKFEKGINQNISKENEESLLEQNENIKKNQVLNYFLSICYGNVDVNGIIDVNKVKTDDNIFEKFITEK